MSGYMSGYNSGCTSGYVGEAGTAEESAYGALDRDGSGVCTAAAPCISLSVYQLEFRLRGER